MEEFKMAHKRMFSATTSSNEGNKAIVAPTHNEKNRADEVRNCTRPNVIILTSSYQTN